MQLRSADLLNHTAERDMFNLTNWFLFPLLFLFFHAVGILTMEVMSLSHPFKSDCRPYILSGRPNQDLIVSPPTVKSNCVLISLKFNCPIEEE